MEKDDNNGFRRAQDYNTPSDFETNASTTNEERKENQPGDDDIFNRLFQQNWRSSENIRGNDPFAQLSLLLLFFQIMAAVMLLYSGQGGIGLGVGVSIYGLMSFLSWLGIPGYERVFNTLASNAMPLIFAIAGMAMMGPTISTTGNVPMTTAVLTGVNSIDAYNSLRQVLRGTPGSQPGMIESLFTRSWVQNSGRSIFEFSTNRSEDQGTGKQFIVGFMVLMVQLFLTMMTLTQTSLDPTIPLMFVVYIAASFYSMSGFYELNWVNMLQSYAVQFALAFLAINQARETPAGGESFALLTIIQMFSAFIIGSTFFLGSNRDNIREVVNTAQRNTNYGEDDFVKIPPSNNNNDNNNNQP